MSTEEEVLDPVSQRLEELADLFRRRLLDDREKRVTIEALQRRVDTLERVCAAEAQRPLVNQIALVIDRLDAADEASRGLASSVAEELCDVLETLGVVEVAGHGAVDQMRHEIVALDGGEGGALQISQLVRRGFEKDGIVLRAAQVRAWRVPLDPTGSVESS